MAKGFDPKWANVALLCKPRGLEGQSVISAEKSVAMNTSGGVVISRLCPAFPLGAAYFGNPAASQSVYPFEQGFTYSDQCYEMELWPINLSGDGHRYLFSVSSILRVYIDLSASLLRIDFTNATLQQYSAAVDLVDLNEKAAKIIVRLSTSRISCELNGDVLIDEAHGLGSFSTASGAILSIGNRAIDGNETTNFRGYIGQFRRTINDLRPEETSATLTEFDALSSLDVYRENVVFHSHCEPTGGPIEDECGNVVSFYGDAEISTTYKAFGVGSFRPRTGGATIEFDSVLGTRDFTFEAFAKIHYNSANRAWCFALLDSSGDVALGLVAMRDDYAAETVVIVNGVSHSVASSLSAGMKFVSLDRNGNDMALFINGARVLVIDVTGVSIANATPLYLGKPPSIVETVAETLYLDEIRFTIGQARTSPLAATLTVPTERFNEYGPHSLRGTVKRMVDGSPVLKSGALVAAFDRGTLRLVSRDLSAADGSFELPSAHGDDHFVLAFDDDMNLVGYDKIKPAIFS